MTGEFDGEEARDHSRASSAPSFPPSPGRTHDSPRTESAGWADGSALSDGAHPAASASAPQVEDSATFPQAVWDAAGSADSRRLLEGFAEMLVREGELRGLIGPREIDRIWSRHIVNSLAVVPFLPAEGTVADLGSGAGLPGVVIACVRPDLPIVLIEPMERRCAWLGDVVEELGLENVEIRMARAEELHGKFTADAVTARAVAALDKLARWALPLVANSGSLLALKGERARDELEMAEKVLRRLKVRSAEVHDVVSPLDGSTTRVVEIRR